MITCDLVPQRFIRKNKIKNFRYCFVMYFSTNGIFLNIFVIKYEFQIGLLLNLFKELNHIHVFKYKINPILLRPHFRI